MSFENVDGRTTDGRTPDAFIYYKLTYEPSGELKKKKTLAHYIIHNLITFSYASTLLKTMHDSGQVQILIILHVVCVAPGNKHN